MSGMWERMLDNTAFENSIKSRSGCSLYGMRDSERDGKIMKKVEHYICEICGTEYNNKLKCEECESGHVKPVKIDGANWVSMRNNGSGYPTQIHVKMSNGETITYKR